MRVTGSTFLIGSLAICGLPPFNGFVSEFFIYFGSFKGISLDGGSFVWSFFAIISLAIIGGLALAFFTKVFGVVFQGEPRTRAAENLNEKGPAMLVSMLILAALCLVIGVFPKVFVIMAVKAMAPLNIVYPGNMIEPFIRITGNITRACAIFFAVFLIVLALRRFLYQNKTVESSGTWGCGFTQPTVKMQYTGSSYAASILQFFGPLAPLKEDHPPVKGRFPDKTHYRSHIEDIAEIFTLKGIVYPVLWLFDKLRWIQHGDIHLYIGYILLAIVALLFFI
jgi:hydrogenase-4 component B